MPSTAAIIDSQPMTSRPRDSGLGGRRSSRRAVKNSTTGSTMTSEPMIQRTAWATPAPTGPIPLLQVAAPRTMARPSTARPTPSLRCSGASGSASSGRATERASPPAPRATRFQVPRAARQRPNPDDCFFRAAGRRLAVVRFAGRFLLAAVDPERPREDAGRRVGVVRAGMRRTVIASGAPARQAEARVPCGRGWATSFRHICDRAAELLPPRDQEGDCDMANPQPDGFGRVDLPTGTVTFLLTDIEGSTRLWETAPDAMEAALKQH